MDLAPITLEERHVRLEPLSLAHVDGLCAVGFDESIWRWNPRPPIRTRADMQRYVESALAARDAGLALPFATLERKAGRPIGSTRFHGPDRASRHIEIGYTWLGPDWQSTAANTEAKLLMLQHASETLGCIRVELKTDSLNAGSRNAIARLGAKEEGIFRNHVITHSGRIRHSVFFSILDSEWLTVKANLNAKLGRS